jgi:site-specific DNA recombinase
VPADEWISIPVPALVDEALFDAVQDQLQENRRRARQRKRGARYLLQGLLECAQCGYSYYGKAISNKAAKGKQRDYAYYRCIGTDAYRFGGERVCDNLQVRTDRLDQMVWEEVRDLLQDGERLRQEYQRRLHAPRREEDNLATTRAQMAKVRKGMGRLIDSYAEGWIERGEFEPRITRLRQRLMDLETRAGQITDQIALQEELHQVVHRLEDFTIKIRDGLAEADWLTRRDLIRTLVKRVEIGIEEVNVVFRIPPDPVVSDPNGKNLQYCRKRGLTSPCQYLPEPVRSGMAKARSWSVLPVRR